MPRHPPYIDDDTVFDHSPNYGSGVSTASPIQYFCQKNFAVLLTDGRPQSDQAIGNNTGLRDYDGDCPNGNDGVTCDNYDMKIGQGYESAGSDYLDDVAKALYELDLRPDLDDVEGHEVKNNIVTYTIGFADDQVINDPLMQDTAANGGGLFLQAANSNQLTAAFETATGDIFAQLKSSASSLAFNTGSVRAGSQIYQARFYPDTWHGELVAIALHDGTGNNGCSVLDPLGSLCPNPVWDAGCTLTGGSCNSTGASIANPNLGAAREILTYNSTSRTGVPLQWTTIATDQKEALQTNAGGNLDSEVTGMARLGYLRGDRGCEEGSTGICSYTDGTDTFTSKVFRARESLLGDTVHGSPLFVGIPSRRFPGTWHDNLGGTLPENGSTAQTYEAFKQGHNTRMTMVYIAANDGFVHGFESGKFDSSGNLESGTNLGKELLAFMPSKALLNARFLTYSNYTHRYFVDGEPVENDVFYADLWHSVLVGTLGGGGQGL
jgi:type IV pilus assembly protein PilY1